MAYKHAERARSIPSRGKREMTVEEFKKWLMSFDKDNDGRISQEELREAIRSCRRVWFSSWKSGRGLKEADRDGSGFIDETEIDSLLEFAEKNMGLMFY